MRHAMFLLIVLCLSPFAWADLNADSPVTFPREGALPPRYLADRPAQDGREVEPGTFIASSPERSLEQIRRIQAEMPAGQFSVPKGQGKHLARTRRVLVEGGRLHIVALGDSIINDTMRSGWVALLQSAYPKAEIRATLCVRGGGGCQHYKDDGRVAKFVAPLQPDLVLIGGISQKDIESLRAVIRQLRETSPEVEILLTTGAFGPADPRDPTELAGAAYSGTGPYGEALRRLADEERCAFLDMTTPWAEYLRSAPVHPHLFYRDAVHANEFGEQVLARILVEAFRNLTER